MNFYFVMFNFMLFEGDFYVYVVGGNVCFLCVINVGVDVNLFQYLVIFGSLVDLSFDFEVEIIEVIGMYILKNIFVCKVLCFILMFICVFVVCFSQFIE